MEYEQLTPAGLQREIEKLRNQVTVNRGVIDELVAGAEASTQRADASDAREQALRDRADAIEGLVEKDQLRLDDMEDRLDIDRELILELHDAGVLRNGEVAHLHHALATSRTIGAAIGIVMARRVVSQDEAFNILREANQLSNRKPRDIAEELVLTGDVSRLPAA